MNIHRLFLSSKRVAFFTERLPTYISSYKHYTFHVRHYRFRIPGNFSFFSFLSIYPTKYVCIYFTRTNMYNRRNTAECIERFYYIIAFRDIHFLNNERMRKKRINPYYLINFDRFGHDPIRWRPGKIKLSDWTRLYCKVIFAHVCIYLIFAKKKKKKKEKESINIFI